MGRYTKYLGLLLLIGLATSLIKSYQKAGRTKAAIEKEKAKIEELKKENATLEEDLGRARTAASIGKQL